MKCIETYAHDLHIPVRCACSGMEPGNEVFLTIRTQCITVYVK